MWHVALRSQVEYIAPSIARIRWAFESEVKPPSALAPPSSPGQHVLPDHGFQNGLLLTAPRFPAGFAGAYPSPAFSALDAWNKSVALSLSVLGQHDGAWALHYSFLHAPYLEGVGGRRCQAMNGDVAPVFTATWAQQLAPPLRARPRRAALSIFFCALAPH